MLSVNTNISSLNAQRSLLSSSQGAAVAMERLASGKRINSAKDDAAGIAIASRLESQVKGVTQGMRNLSDATSVLQVAEGGMASIETNLQRIRELAVQAANGSYSDADRSSLNNEATQLLAEIDRVASTTSFDGQSLLDGTFTNKSFNLGNAGDDLSISVDQLKVTSSASAIAGQEKTIAGSVSNTSAPYVTRNSAGETLVLWSTRPSGGGNGTIYFQKIDDSGNAIGSTNVIASDYGIDKTPNVTELSDGSLAITFDDWNAGYKEVYVALTDADGNVSSTFLARDNTVPVGDYMNPHIVDLGSSEFALFYDYSPNHPQLATIDKLVQKFTYGGAKVGSESSIYASSTGNTSNLVVSSDPVTLSDGNLAFITKDYSDGTNLNIVLSVLDGDDFTRLYQATLGTYSQTQNVVISVAAKDTGMVAAWTDVANQSARIATLSNSLSLESSAVISDATIDTRALKIVTSLSTGREYIDIAYRDFNKTTSYFNRYNSGLSPEVERYLVANQGNPVSLDTLADGTPRVFYANSASSVAHVSLTMTESNNIDLTSQLSSQLTIAATDNALTNLSASRAKVGAQMNRIESAMSTLQITKENSAAAKSRIEDADYAAETAKLAKHQILQQASISVLAQANSRPEMVLALLRDL